MIHFESLPKTRTYGLILLLAVWIFTGCEEPASGAKTPSPLHREYTLTYTEDSQQTCARARFNTDSAHDNSVELESPAHVYFDAGTMYAGSYIGYSYETCAGYGLDRSHFWVFQDRDRNAYSVTAKVTPISVPNLPSTIDGNVPFSIEVGDLAPVDGESFFVNVRGPTQAYPDRDAIGKRLAIVDGTRLTFPTNAFVGYAAGPIHISFSREGNLNMPASSQNGPAGTSVNTYFLTKEYPVTLTF